MHVRWLLNPDEEPRENVSITEQHGLVVDVRSIRAGESSILPAVLIPPLVNAHTHLEFSALSEPLTPANPFQDWIRSVIQWRQQSSVEANDSIAAGLNESENVGVRLIGEIATQNEFPIKFSTRTEVIAFREAIGLRPDRINQQIQMVREFLSAPNAVGVQRAVSPHAPYTVHPDLLHELVALAVQQNAPVAMHLAETNDEVELLGTGQGRFADFLKSLGMYDASTFPGGRSVLQILKELAVAPKALAVHGNYFTDHDIAFLSKHPGITTVYCPRTHAFFGHPAHPWRKLLSAGCRVVLGTDSRASNPDLSVWKELQHVARIATDISAERLISMVTTHSADAMGYDPDKYCITVGKPLAPVLLSYDQSLANMNAIIRDPGTSPVSWHAPIKLT